MICYLHVFALKLYKLKFEINRLNSKIKKLLKHLAGQVACNFVDLLVRELVEQRLETNLEYRIEILNAIFMQKY